MKVIIVIIALVVAIIAAGITWLKSLDSQPSCSSAQRSDYGPWLQSYDIKYPFKSDGVTVQSHYVTMRDGVKIAVDVYLPTRALLENMRLPTILHGTRYYRSTAISFPFSLLMGKNFNPRRKTYVDPLVHSGYAFVSYDVRGTGASGGYREFDLGVKELEDIPQIIDWVLKQRWTNKMLGAWGISYEGMVTEATLSFAHPALKAVAPFFAPFDMYRDVSHVGGVFSSAFFDTYGSVVGKFERNAPMTHETSFLSRFYFNYISKGAARVSESEEDLKYYEQAQQEHQKNWHVQHGLKLAEYSDTPIAMLNNSSIDDHAGQQIQSIIENKNVGVLGLSAWYDGAFVQSTITRFKSVSTPTKKLILGPWNHGAQSSVSPFSDTRRVCFNFYKEMIAFFDYHLKREDYGYYNAEHNSAVKYYTIGEEAWNYANDWPPQSTTTKLHFGKNNQLSSKPTESLEWQQYKIDFDISTDKFSRWNLILQMQPNSLKYDQLKQSNIQRLVYTSEPFEHDVEITGHPYVHLSFKANNVDTVIFAYLMDQDDEKDTLTYVTEGHLRAVHRKETEHELIKSVHPYRTFKKTDITLLTPEQEEEMNIYLMPISYLIKKNHRLVFAISGSDVDNFDLSEFQNQLATEIHINLLKSHLVIPSKVRE